MNNSCAPGKKFKDGSCYTLADLVSISKSYNNIQGQYIGLIKLSKEGIKIFKKV